MASLYKILYLPVYKETDWNEILEHEDCFESETDETEIETFSDDALKSLLKNDKISNELKENIKSGLKKYSKENPDSYVFYYEG